MNFQGTVKFAGLEALSLANKHEMLHMRQYDTLRLYLLHDIFNILSPASSTHDLSHHFPCNRVISITPQLHPMASTRSEDGSTGVINDGTVNRRTTTGQPKLRKTVETRQQGRVKFQNYLTYFMAGAGWPGCVVVVFLYLVAVTAAVAFDLIVAHWQVHFLTVTPWIDLLMPMLQKVLCA